jgi:hypothetical protein
LGERQRKERRARRGGLAKLQPVQRHLLRRQHRHREEGAKARGGFAAWLVWLVIHLLYLIEFENRLLVLIQWSNQYLRSSRGSRLITADDGG